MAGGPCLKGRGLPLVGSLDAGDDSRHNNCNMIYEVKREKKYAEEVDERR
jgi:hypothetical protein